MYSSFTSNFVRRVPHCKMTMAAVAAMPSTTHLAFPVICDTRGVLIFDAEAELIPEPEFGLLPLRKPKTLCMLMLRLLTLRLSYLLLY